MVKSLTFTGESGYISEKIPEPHCSVRGFFKDSKYSNWDRFSKEDLQRIDK